MQAPIAVHVLGTVQLLVGGQPVRLTPSEATLLACLGLRHPHVVPIGTIADWLWDHDERASPRNRIQALVSGIRRKTIHTHHEGYGLAADAAVDASRRRALLRRAVQTDLTWASAPRCCATPTTSAAWSRCRAAMTPARSTPLAPSCGRRHWR